MSQFSTMPDSICHFSHVKRLKMQIYDLTIVRVAIPCLVKYTYTQTYILIVYSGAKSFACCAASGQGSGNIWLDRYTCPEDACSIHHCTGWTWGVHDCGHHEDASVSCFTGRCNQADVGWLLKSQPNLLYVQQLVQAKKIWKPPLLALN